MESKLKLKISRMFRSSFGSCRPKRVTYVLQNPIFVPPNHQNFQKFDHLAPKTRPFPSICRPKLPESTEIEKNSDLEVLERKKFAENGETEGGTSPPASPSSHSNFFSNFEDFESGERQKKTQKVINRSNKKNKKKLSFSSSSDNNGWFTSDEEDEIEDETETFFSSKSFSSDSSESRRKNKNSFRKRVESRRRRSLRKSTEMGIGESLAVVKKSNDPYNDFRVSMVEMIIEKEIFEAKDLENLLKCFLSLNSSYHHRVIIEVFTEIWDALFSKNKHNVLH